MRKLLTNLTMLILLIGLISCDNVTNNVNVYWGKGKEICLAVKLPGKTSRAVEYYTEADVHHYVVELINDTVVDSATGNPGETVFVKTLEEGVYSIKVTGYNEEGKVVAEGIGTMTLGFDNLKPVISVKMSPKPKEIELEVIIDWGSTTIEPVTTEDLVPNTMVKITGEGYLKDFYISNTEVTYERWYEVYQWAIKHGYVFANLGREGSNGIDGAEPQGSTQPVTWVAWRDIIVWCNAASQMDGLAPVYYTRGASDFTTETFLIKIAEKINWEGNAGVSYHGTNPNNNYCADMGNGKADTCVRNEDANGYRLPVEKEWKYAYKGGKKYKYSGSNNLDEVAWYVDNSNNQTHDVGKKLPNDYGLYDMCGNVQERCWEWPTNNRLIFGGGFSSSELLCVVTDNFESRSYIYNVNSDYGLRIAQNAY